MASQTDDNYQMVVEVRLGLFMSCSVYIAFKQIRSLFGRSSNDTPRGKKVEVDAEKATTGLPGRGYYFPLLAGRECMVLDILLDRRTNDYHPGIAYAHPAIKTALQVYKASIRYTCSGRLNIKFLILQASK